MSSNLEFKQVIGAKEGYKLAKLNSLLNAEVTIDEFIGLLNLYKQQIPNPDQTKIRICGASDIHFYIDTEDNLIIDHNDLDGDLE